MEITTITSKTVGTSSWCLGDYDVDEDFVTTNNGFSIQLNCYSQNLKNVLSTWQQYVIYLSAGQKQLWARIDNWEGTDAKPTEFLRVDQALAVLPTANTVKQGYSFEFILINDANGNVTGCTYTVRDNTGNNVGNQTISIVGQTSRQGTVVTSAYVAPIVAFAFNIGGEYSGFDGSVDTGQRGYHHIQLSQFPHERKRGAKLHSF